MAESSGSAYGVYSSSNGSTRSGRGRLPEDRDELIQQIRRFSSVSQEDFDQMRLAEKEDDFFALRKATDITDPDTKGDPCPPLPIKLIHGSFRHILGVREACSKQGTFLQRTIELKRKPGESLGFYIRQGDGWEREDGIFVSRVVLGTDVDVFELLRVGDEIVKVNKVDVRAMSIEDVSALMQMTRRLILTVKVLTPISSRKLALKDGSSIRSAASSKTSRSDSLASSTSGRFPDRRNPQDRRTGSSARLGPEPMNHYKVANLVIGRNKDAIHSGQHMPAPGMSPGSAPQKSSSRRGTKSPVIGKRALSPIRESSTDLHSNLDERSQGRTSRAASVVSWSDQFYESGSSTSPVKYRPNTDRKRSEASGSRPR
ncbi:uncharacterized protein LOC116288608 [Actinia tenebrosa]|uniref:Uncharacterized protein LOC116288608 n=1 Tax=Actinia tenebrosa TaxID=6105 RepID=A0A6P8H4K2_ACTTE|nr:uncharacterized protein LOC116288608 [Actinia tenebrosa]